LRQRIGQFHFKAGELPALFVVERRVGAFECHLERAALLDGVQQVGGAGAQRECQKKCGSDGLADIHIQSLHKRIVIEMNVNIRRIAHWVHRTPQKPYAQSG